MAGLAVLHFEEQLNLILIDSSFLSFVSVGRKSDRLVVLRDPHCDRSKGSVRRKIESQIDKERLRVHLYAHAFAYIT